MANVRFFRRGVTRVWFTSQMSVSGTPAVMKPDLSNNDLRDTGTGGPGGAPEAKDLTPFISDMSGFTFSNTPIGVPDLTDNFDAQIPGVDAAANSQLKFYEYRDDAGNAAGGGSGNDALRKAVQKGKSGFIVIFWGGCTNDGSGNPGPTPTAGDLCEVWPSTSTGPAREYVMTPTAGQWNASFSISARPNVDSVVVA